MPARPAAPSRTTPPALAATDLDALRKQLWNLLWLTAWAESHNLGAADPAVADRHLRFLAKIEAVVRGHVASIPVASVGGFAVGIQDPRLAQLFVGVVEVLRQHVEQGKSGIAMQRRDADAVQGIVALLAEFGRTTGSSAPDHKAVSSTWQALQRAVTSKGGKPRSWITEHQGPMQAGADLLEALDLGGHRRFFALKSVLGKNDEASVGVVEGAHGGALTRRQLQRSVMRMIGFGDDAINAAIAADSRALDEELDDVTLRPS